MVYEYNPRIVNQKKIENFYDKSNFVGYILPNGEIFECKEHNVSNAITFLRMYLDILDTDYHKKDEILDSETNNRLLKILQYKLKKMSHDEIHALRVFIHNSSFNKCRSSPASASSWPT